MLGLTFAQGIFLGALLALSSTVVALKVLMARGELDALHGRVALGILIAQDIAVVPMVVVLPTLAAGGDGLVTELALAAVKASAVLAGAYLLGSRAIPWLLNHVAAARSRELFLLMVVGLALGTALLTNAAGLSLAFGAFLAGLAVAESEYRTQIVAEVLPLRDLFVGLFFVSVGMLIDPLSLLAQAGSWRCSSAIVVLGKLAIVVVVILLFGFPGQVALLRRSEPGADRRVLLRPGPSRDRQRRDTAHPVAADPRHRPGHHPAHADPVAPGAAGCWTCWSGCR